MLTQRQDKYRVEISRWQSFSVTLFCDPPWQVPLSWSMWGAREGAAAPWWEQSWSLRWSSRQVTLWKFIWATHGVCTHSTRVAHVVQSTQEATNVSLTKGEKREVGSSLGSWCLACLLTLKWQFAQGTECASTGTGLRIAWLGFIHKER